MGALPTRVPPSQTAAGGLAPFAPRLGPEPVADPEVRVREVHLGPREGARLSHTATYTSAARSR